MAVSVPIQQYIGDTWIFPNTVYDTKLSGVTVLAGGSGYTSAPQVAFPAPTLTPALLGGRQATGTATVSGGVITGITITDPGQGYDRTIAQPVVLIGGAGSGGLASASVGNLVNLSSLTVAGEYWTANASAPQFTPLTVLNGRVIMTDAVNGKFTLTLESAVTSLAIPQTPAANTYQTRIHVYVTDTLGNKTTLDIIYILPLQPRSV